MSRHQKRSDQLARERRIQVRHEWRENMMAEAHRQHEAKRIARQEAAQAEAAEVDGERAA